MTWGERIDTRLHAKDSAAQECMAIVRALAAERDALQVLLRKSLEREEQIEKELSEARAQAAVLRGALLNNRIKFCEKFDNRKNHSTICYPPWGIICEELENCEEIERILSTTPSEAAERVQKLAELLQDAVSETENAERLSEGFCSAAKAALSEWRRDK